MNLCHINSESLKATYKKLPPIIRYPALGIGVVMLIPTALVLGLLLCFMGAFVLYAVVLAGSFAGHHVHGVWFYASVAVAVLVIAYWVGMFVEQKDVEKAFSWLGKLWGFPLLMFIVSFFLNDADRAIIIWGLVGIAGVLNYAVLFIVKMSAFSKKNTKGEIEEDDAASIALVTLLNVIAYLVLLVNKIGFDLVGIPYAP